VVQGNLPASRHAAEWILREIEIRNQEKSKTVNKRSGVLYVCILALTLLLSGCASAATATPVPATLRPATPTSTATKVAPATAVPTAVPTAVATVAPTLPPATTVPAAATPTVAPATTPANTPAATAPAATTPAATGGAGKPLAASTKDACLACHGPFEKIIAATANYVMPTGEKLSPHRYDPHTSKAVKDIPECINCHKPHPASPTAADIAAMPKPDTGYCYGCHHAGVLECGTCHSV
jgi:hypothetical protein